ncbi:flagellar FliJ family protein [Metabacillus sp. YM-086]
MNEKQIKLMQKNIEVKKYEKLKEKQLEQYILATKHSENKQMDDLSIQSYMYRGS